MRVPWYGGRICFYLAKHFPGDWKLNIAMMTCLRRYILWHLKGRAAEALAISADCVLYVGAYIATIGWL